MLRGDTWRLGRAQTETVPAAMDGPSGGSAPTMPRCLPSPVPGARRRQTATCRCGRKRGGLAARAHAAALPGHARSWRAAGPQDTRALPQPVGQRSWDRPAPMLPPNLRANIRKRGGDPHRWTQTDTRQRLLRHEARGEALAGGPVAPHRLLPADQGGTAGGRPGGRAGLRGSTGTSVGSRRSQESLAGSAETHTSTQ